MTLGHEPILPPAMLGILGGGQLGRYFVMAARQMGYRTAVLEPDPSCPAGAVADVHLLAPYDDTAALGQLADMCAVITTEFENAPASALVAIADRTTIRPAPGAIGITQDRIAEKAFLSQIGANVAPYRVIQSEADLAAASTLTFPAILKTSRLGYDGKGQRGCRTLADVADAWDELGQVPCVLEQRLNLLRELSVVLARTSDDRVACFPVGQNLHVHGILDTTYVPASLPAGSADAAAELCTHIARELDFVGVMAVEMFVVGNDVLVNELAPRPHNTGHYTLDACVTSQFEQQVRAICGLALGSAELRVPGVAMVNLLGEMWDGGDPRWEVPLLNPSVHLHLYGKSEPRPGRKMGHLTVHAQTALGAASLARRLRKQCTTG